VLEKFAASWVADPKKSEFNGVSTHGDVQRQRVDEAISGCRVEIPKETNETVQQYRLDVCSV